MTILRAIFLICLLGLALPVAAQSPAASPQVEVVIDPTEGVTVGTALRVTLNILSPSYLLKTPVWPDLQIADAITRIPPNTSRPSSRVIDGVNWTVISRVYEITPQRAAEFALDPQEITFTYADPATNQPVEAKVAVPAISFPATVPKGAEGLSPFIAADQLTVTETIEGPGDNPTPGAAVTRTLTIEAQGTEAMLLPALLGSAAPAGLRAYPRQPDLSDQAGQRGAPASARRIESVTYVVETPGDYVLPPVKLDWWNSKAARIESAEAKGASFSVPVPPGWHPPGTPDPRRVLLLRAGGIALLVLALLWFGRRHIRAGLAAMAHSEPVLFRRLLGRVRQGRIGEARDMLWPWLSALGQRQVPAGVEAALRGAEREIWGPDGQATLPSPARRRAVVAALGDARRTLRAGRKSAGASTLPPLNPW